MYLRKLIRLDGVFLLLSSNFQTEISADVVRNKDESEYGARLAEMGYATVSEGIETTAWDAVRSPSIDDRNQLPGLTTQGLTWETAARDDWGDFGGSVHGITTNHN